MKKLITLALGVGLITAAVATPAYASPGTRYKPGHRLSVTDPTVPGPTVSGNEYVRDWQYAGTTDPLQSLTSDMYSGRNGAPWVLLIHGGSWTGGDRSYEQAESDLFFSRGWQTFNVDYRRGTDTNPSAAMQRADINAAYDYVISRAAAFHIAPGRGTVFGFSAGGQLAAQLANDRPLSSAVEEDGVLQPQRFPLAIAAGNTDGEVAYIYSREQSLTGCAYSTDTTTACGQAWRQFEPEYGLDPNTAPTYVMYGEDDPLFCDDAARSFYYWLGYHGVSPRVLVGVPGLGHTNQVLLGSQDRITALLQWIGQQWS